MEIIAKKGPTDKRKGITILRQKRIKLTREDGWKGINKKEYDETHDRIFGKKIIKSLSNADRRRLNLEQDPDLDDFDKDYKIKKEVNEIAKRSRKKIIVKPRLKERQKKEEIKNEEINDTSSNS